MPGVDKVRAEDFVDELRPTNETLHLAQTTNARRSAVDGRTTRMADMPSTSAHLGGARQIQGGRRARQEKTSFCDRDRVESAFTFDAAVYNLMRLQKRNEVG